ncbi:MAG: hypothetical protein C0616_02740 [Desulfuromonas sp.]|nr:MAG: hypothetical protein C0616_02740 [Desulfuromonas sp.]
MNTAKTIGLLALLVSLTGCGHVISQAARDQVTPNLDFTEVRQNPEVHRGETLLLGGVIVGLKTEAEGSELEVYNWGLDRWGEPVAVDDGSGRFLVRTERLLDPVVYPPGRLVTLTATVTGVEERSLLGVTNYRYPVLQLGEIYSWQSPYRYMLYPGPYPYRPIYVEEGTRLRTNPYDPSYYNYPYTPYDMRYFWP